MPMHPKPRAETTSSLRPRRRCGIGVNRLASVAVLYLGGLPVWIQGKQAEPALELTHYVAGARFVSRPRPSQAASSCRARDKRVFSEFREGPNTVAPISAE